MTQSVFISCRMQGFFPGTLSLPAGLESGCSPLLQRGSPAELSTSAAAGTQNSWAGIPGWTRPEQLQDGISGGGHHTSLCLLLIWADFGSSGTGQDSPEGISCANKALQRLCIPSPKPGRAFPLCHLLPLLSNALARTCLPQHWQRWAPSPSPLPGHAPNTSPGVGIHRLSTGIYPLRDQSAGREARASKSHTRLGILPPDLRHCHCSLTLPWAAAATLGSHSSRGKRIWMCHKTSPRSQTLLL